MATASLSERVQAHLQAHLQEHMSEHLLTTAVAYAMQVAPELSERLFLAAQLVRAGHVEPSQTGTPLWYVRSQDPGQPTRFYAIGERQQGPWSCTCPDYEQYQTWCKHALAAALVKRIGGARAC